MPTKEAAMQSVTMTLGASGGGARGNSRLYEETQIKEQACHGKAEPRVGAP